MFSSLYTLRALFLGSALFFGAFLFAPGHVFAAHSGYTVNLLTPSSGVSIPADTISRITWQTGEGDASFADLYYSEDGGATWNLIVKNTVNDGSYHWTVAHIQSQTVTVKIVTTDLVDELASDMSDTFSVWFYEEDNSAYWDEGAKPTTEVLTDIDGIKAGDFITVPGIDGISYIDEGLVRRPLFSEETYFTYEESANAMLEVSENTLHKFALGAPLAPKTGTVLVKTPSLSRVYWIEEDMYGTPELRWVTSEALAEEMFGVNWSAYVIDIEPSVFTRYHMGADINAAYTIDRTQMKLATELHR